MKWVLVASGAVLLALAAWIIGLRGWNPMKAVKLELDVIDAKERAEKLVVNQGASEARRKLEMEHKETIEHFDEEQKKQATELAADPVALSAFLVRAGKRS